MPQSSYTQSRNAPRSALGLRRVATNTVSGGGSMCSGTASCVPVSAHASCGLSRADLGPGSLTKLAGSSAPFDASSPQYRSLLKKMQAMGLSDAQWGLVRDDELASGHPYPFLLMLRHLLDPSAGPAPHAVSEIFRQQTWFVVESNDERFVHSTFRLLRVHFAVAPALKEPQFLRPGQFAADKAAIVSTLASLLHRREKTIIACDESLAQRRLSHSQQQQQQQRPLRIAGCTSGAVPAGSPRATALTVIEARVVADAANRSAASPVPQSPCCGLNASDAVARCRYEREAAAAEARRREVAAHFDERHRALSRVPRRPSALDGAAQQQSPPQAGMRHPAPRSGTCWYCSAALPQPRSAGAPSPACTACGSPPAEGLRRTELRSDNLTAHSNSSNEEL